MIKYVALYRTPTDPAAFDRDYFGSHVPIVNDTPGLVRTELAKVTRTLTGEPAYYLVAELYFESPESMTAAFKSDPWRASGANLQEWGGMELVTMFTAEVVDDTGGLAGARADRSFLPGASAPPRPRSVETADPRVLGRWGRPTGAGLRTCAAERAARGSFCRTSRVSGATRRAARAAGSSVVGAAGGRGGGRAPRPGFRLPVGAEVLVPKAAHDLVVALQPAGEHLQDGRTSHLAQGQARRPVLSVPPTRLEHMFEAHRSSSPCPRWSGWPTRPDRATTPPPSWRWSGC